MLNKKKKGKGKKKFIMFKQPRYLPGAVTKNVWLLDLISYNKHRYNCLTAKPKIDANSPQMNPYIYFKSRKLRNAAERLQEIDKENKQLLKKINYINRNGGKVDTFNPAAYNEMSNWAHHESAMKHIELENMKLYKLIKSVKSAYNKEDLDVFWKTCMEKISGEIKLPLVLFKKQKLDDIFKKQPSISGNLEKLADRPFCFLEFQVLKGEKLGTVIIELYHDHVPVTVQNFLGICRGETNLTYAGCILHRIIPGKFLETGDITQGTGRGGFSIYGDQFDEERHLLKHSKGGVLSMKRIGKQKNNSQFIITFSKMEQFDKKNVVFGKIVEGADTLVKIQGYGRKIGKPLATLVISKCGEFSY